MIPLFNTSLPAYTGHWRGRMRPASICIQPRSATPAEQDALTVDENGALQKSCTGNDRTTE